MKLYDLLTFTFNNEENVHEKWTTAYILPIHKKSNKLKCINYRGISNEYNFFFI